MRRFLLLLSFTFFLGRAVHAQDPGCWSPPQVLSSLSKTVCYICKLSHFQERPVLGFPMSEPEQVLQFEVVNVANDPFLPKTISITTEGGKYYYGFFKEDKIYAVVATHSYVPHYFNEWGPGNFSCFMPQVVYTDEYTPISISGSE